MANQASAANTALANMCKIEWVKLEPCLVFLRTVVRLLREKPDQEKYRRLNKKFDKYQELMRDCPAMEQFLLACGFRDMGDFMSLPAKYNPDVAWLIFAEEQLKTAFMRRGKMVFKDETPRTALKNARAAAASPSKPTTVSPAQARGRTDLAPGAGMSGRDARAGRVASSTFSMAPSTLSRSSSAPRPHVVVTGPAGTIGSVCANTKGQSGSTRPRPSLEEARALLWANPPSKVRVERVDSSRIQAAIMLLHQEKPPLCYLLSRLLCRFSPSLSCSFVGYLGESCLLVPSLCCWPPV